MSDIIPLESDLDDDFNEVPPTVGMSTKLFMETKSGGDPIPLFVCMKCGGTSFEVGREHFTTVARCIVCKVETVIHDG